MHILEWCEALLHLPLPHCSTYNTFETKKLKNFKICLFKVLFYSIFLNYSTDFSISKIQEAKPFFWVMMEDNLSDFKSVFYNVFWVIFTKCTSGYVTAQFRTLQFPITLRLLTNLNVIPVYCFNTFPPLPSGLNGAFSIISIYFAYPRTFARVILSMCNALHSPMV